MSQNKWLALLIAQTLATRLRLLSKWVHKSANFWLVIIDVTIFVPALGHSLHPASPMTVFCAPACLPCHAL